ncbi:MAG TPA: DUF5597 domain-containing protein [Opitutaceae bacterium]|nr:DUF5597 domain-containing protein [Opitutaceae bacterium]
MKHRFSLAILAAGLLLAGAARAADAALPHLEKRGAATQLVVDGKPFLVLGGETANTASSSLDYMATVWPRLAKMNLNTALVGIAWDWIEPEEGKFDFTTVDGMLRQAREQKMHVAIVWFGSWKNGLSSFAPAWVKRDQQRFPRVRIKSGKSVEILSVFNDASRDADARAFGALLRHVRENDPQHTVIMVQVENEVGILGDSRDRLPAADAAWTQPVPSEVIARVRSEAAWPALKKVWQDAGAKTAGAWAEVFGTSTAAEEIFQAWHYARYMDRVAAAGKAELLIPFFTNTWIVQPEDKGPGDYPTGGPEPLTIDLWRVGAPHIDLNCPDIYLPNFAEWVGRFHRADNPLFVPESRGDAGGVANAMFAIGAHHALGYSPFGIDNAGRLTTLRPDATATPPTEIENLPLPRGYALLQQMAPVILDCQAKDTIATVLLSTEHQTEDIALGNYTVNVDLRRNRRNPSQVPASGYAMVLNVGPDEYFVVGADTQVIFYPRPATGEIVGFAQAEIGEFVNGAWKPGRRMNGDDILLRYDLAEAADKNQSGSGLRFNGTTPSVQHVKLYRYR